jgi:hypothetical protein
MKNLQNYDIRMGANLGYHVDISIEYKAGVITVQLING